MSRIFKFYDAPPKQVVEEKLITIKTINKQSVNEQTEMGQSTNQQISQQLADAELQAEQIITTAQVNAEKVSQQIMADRAAWEQEKQLLMEQAQEAGYVTGLDVGRDKGYEEVQTSIQMAQRVVATAKNDYTAKVEAAEGTILRLGLKVAEKIIGNEIETNKATFLSIVKNVLKEVRDECEVQVHVHPTNYQFLLSQQEELLRVFPATATLYIYPNEELEETSCLIESDNGRIDASIDSQLAELRQKLFELLGSE